jgi:hypothetical protein
MARLTEQVVDAAKPKERAYFIQAERAGLFHLVRLASRLRRAHPPDGEEGLLRRLPKPRR